MPTSYTAKLYDDEPQTFPEFALLCARAFGALVTLRDEPMDAPLPEKFDPSPYSAERLAEKTAERDRLKAMTHDEVTAAADDDFEAAMVRWRESEGKLSAMRERYEAMLAKVRGWAPPTPDHAGLRGFMIEQLEMSISRDCYSLIFPERQTADEWHKENLARIECEIEHYAEHAVDERERAESRTGWLTALRQSLEVTS